MGELHHPATKLQEFGAAPTFVDYRPHARQFAAGMSARLRLNKHLAYPGDVVFQHACKMGLEGIVSKRLGSIYRSGRSKDWLKFKNPDAPAVRREAEEDWS
jgi:bifunctional non-homologous end joining protein LigD